MSTFGRWRDASRALVFTRPQSSNSGALFDTMSMRSVPMDPVAPKTTIFLLLLYVMCCSFVSLLVFWLCRDSWIMNEVAQFSASVYACTHDNKGYFVAIHWVVRQWLKVVGIFCLRVNMFFRCFACAENCERLGCFASMQLLTFVSC